MLAVAGAIISGSIEHAVRSHIKISSKEEDYSSAATTGSPAAALILAAAGAAATPTEHGDG
jgi:hypothetical protein